MTKTDKKMQPIKVEAIETPTATLDTMRTGSTIYAPCYQRGSIDTTRQRMKNYSSKRFALKKENDEFFSIKRVR